MIIRFGERDVMLYAPFLHTTRALVASREVSTTLSVLKRQGGARGGGDGWTGPSKDVGRDGTDQSGRETVVFRPVPKYPRLFRDRPGFKYS